MHCIFKHDIIGFKKVCPASRCATYIVTLLIPAGTPIYCCDFETKRIYSGKARAYCAEVLAISGGRESVVHRIRSWISGRLEYSMVCDTEYRVGDTVYPHEWEESDMQCGGGIHFYFSRDEASRCRLYEARRKR